METGAETQFVGSPKGEIDKKVSKPLRALYVVGNAHAVRRHQLVLYAQLPSESAQL